MKRPTGQATDDSIIWRMRFACRISMPADPHSEYVLLIFHSDSIYAKASVYYVVIQGC